MRVTVGVDVGVALGVRLGVAVLLGEAVIVLVAVEAGGGGV